jgi:hypothetical protein
MQDAVQQVTLVPTPAKWDHDFKYVLFPHLLLLCVLQGAEDQ